MSESDYDFDETAHEKLLCDITRLGDSSTKKNSVNVKKHIQKVSASSLVAAIHSTKNLQDVKSELKKKGKNEGKIVTKALQAPLHRQARERLEGSIAYDEIRKDLDIWTSVVQKNRVADQLSFPLEKDEVYVQTGTERKHAFKPRTPLDIELAKVLGETKNNLGNEDKYTEAEKELIKAMSLKEAKAKCAQLQKMRALMSYKEAKLKRQAKIKSKSYHRHLKRLKRKQLLKEFDELLVKDPEAAKEKLAEIEKQRIIERATLKHRNGSKRMQMLARHAGKDREAKKFLEEQIRIGRELTEKVVTNEDSDEGSDNDEQAMSAQSFLEKAVALASEEDVLETSSNPKLLTSLKKMRENKKVENFRSAIRGAQLFQTLGAKPVKSSENLPVENSIVWDEDSDWYSNEKLASQLSADDTKQAEIEEEGGKQSDTVDQESSDQEITNDTQNFKGDAVGNNRKKSGKHKLTKGKLGESDNGKTKKRNFEKKAKKTKTKKSKTGTLKDVDNKTIDAMFDEAEEQLLISAKRVAEELQGAESTSIIHCEIESTSEKLDKDFVRPNVCKTSPNTLRKDDEVDISMDPKHFLQIEAKALTQVTPDLMEKVDDFDEQVEQEALIAEAFKDDDVVELFEMEKSAVEAAEKPKDIDLTLAGWGSWTGPGISNKSKKKFIIKEKPKKRRDEGRHGLIISEVADAHIEKSQLHSIPFPFTTVADYEAVVRQPIGKDWNTPSTFHNLTKPHVITKSGKIIKPLNKDSALEEVAKELSTEGD